MGSGEFTPTPVAQRSYGGIGRLKYVGFCMLAGFIYNAVAVGAVALAEAGNGLEAVGSGLILFSFVCYMAAGFYIAVLRLKNMGSNPWWCAALIVPLLNFYVGSRMLICPEGYCDHKTLDTPGKIIYGCFIGLFVLVILSFVALGVIGSMANAA